MTVILVTEENHGNLCIAADVPSAIDYLIKHDWLNGHDDCCEHYDKTAKKWVSEQVEQKFGKDWAKVLAAKSREELNTIFDPCFYFYEEEVYNRAEG